ncbi:MAG: hypothetical protein CMK92_03345 [Pseudomonas sp.]|nr:hypothetical protein [Pseudomonas sp.]
MGDTKPSVKPKAWYDWLNSRSQVAGDKTIGNMREGYTNAELNDAYTAYYRFFQRHLEGNTGHVAYKLVLDYMTSGKSNYRRLMDRVRLKRTMAGLDYDDAAADTLEFPLSSEEVRGLRKFVSSARRKSKSGIVDIRYIVKNFKGKTREVFIKAK